MPRKPRTLDTKNLVREYQAGATLAELMVRYDVHFYRLKRCLLEGGATLLSHRERRRLTGLKCRKKIRVSLDVLASRYRAGESENALAKRFGLTRSSLRIRLLEAGITPRDRHTAGIVKWSRMTRAARAAQVRAAHASTRGRTPSIEESMVRAKTVEARGLHISGYERSLAALLRDRGIETIHQQAVGPYNCDLGAYPVAVEVLGGQWHFSGRHLARAPKRLRYFLDRGWSMLMIVVSPKFPLTAEMADYVAAYVKAARVDPAARREYRMIRRAGEVLAAGSADDDEVSVVPALTRGRDSLGRYAAVPR